MHGQQNIKKKKMQYIAPNHCQKTTSIHGGTYSQSVFS